MRRSNRKSNALPTFKSTGFLLLGALALLISFIGIGGGPSGASGATPGVTKTTIDIGMHLPISGTALSLGTGIEAQASLYWTWLAGQHKTVDGRTVHLTIANDQFSASAATQVCASMAPNNFILLGWQGSNVVGACAAYASSQGIPYVARGLSPAFGEDKTYFALSPDYAGEGILTASWMRNEMHVPKGSTVGMITYNTAEFNALVDAFETQAKKLGLKVAVQRISLTASAGEAETAALAVEQAGAKAVYIDIANQVFDIFTTFQQQGYFPGIVTYAADSEAADFCPVLSSNKTDFYALNPTPELDYAKIHDPAFVTAVKKYIGGTPTDTELYFWWQMQLVQQMLLKTGSTLTRANFLKAVADSTISTPLAKPITYTPKNHIGSTNEWMLKLSCSSSPSQFLTAASVHD
jgi:ABC-type branched-subunit amino acid transport system substrate-binding protein